MGMIFMESWKNSLLKKGFEFLSILYIIFSVCSFFNFIILTHMKAQKR